VNPEDACTLLPLLCSRLLRLISANFALFVYADRPFAISVHVRQLEVYLKIIVSRNATHLTPKISGWKFASVREAAFGWNFSYQEK